MNSSDCRDLRQKIYEYGFAVVDVALFLDTHPDDAEALAYYNEVRDKYLEYRKMYTMKYGPLNMTEVLSENRFTWIEQRLPWEREV